MARQRRVLLDGCPVHLVQRGHNKQRCFFSDADYRRYLQWLGEALSAAGCRLHAYVLMTNHVHLLVTPRDAASVPRIVMSLGRTYVRYVNGTQQRTGTLWESRYRSSIVSTDFYLLACYRYIEMNPVRAGMVRDPAEYRWSSYRANALGRADSIVSPHPLYTALAGDDLSRREAYRRLFDTVLDTPTLEEIRRSLHQCQMVGRQDFASRLRLRATRPRVAPVGSDPTGA